LEVDRGPGRKKKKVPPAWLRDGRAIERKKKEERYGGILPKEGPSRFFEGEERGEGRRGPTYNSWTEEERGWLLRKGKEV